MPLKAFRLYFFAYAPSEIQRHVNGFIVCFQFARRVNLKKIVAFLHVSFLFYIKQLQVMTIIIYEVMVSFQNRAVIISHYLSNYKARSTYNVIIHCHELNGKSIILNSALSIAQLWNISSIVRQ